MVSLLARRLGIAMCLTAWPGCGGGGGGGGGGGDEPGCGDGVVEAGEECDNGAQNSDTVAGACRTTCAVASCGDGVEDTGEDCDDGDANSDTEPDACRADCEAPDCGDEVVDDGEACDDGNDNSDDDPDACRESCESASCGDGVVDTGEDCDDNDEIDTNSCANDCTTPALWTRTIDGSLGLGIAVDSTGNVVVVGDVVGASSLDGWVRKYDAGGAALWTQTYNGAADDYDRADGVAIDAAGNVLVTGLETTGLGDTDVWVRKYDSSGGTVWTRTYGGAAGGDDLGSRVATDAGGNVLVAGSEGVAPDPDGGWITDGWIRKYDPAGATLWTRTYAGAAGDYDQALGIAVDSNGDVLVTGSETTATSADAWVRRYDMDGGTIWTRAYSGAQGLGAQGASIAVDGSGDILVTGAELSAAGVVDIFVRKYDSGGTDLWTETHGGAGNDIDISYDIATDASGNVLVTGFEIMTAGAAPDIWTGKFDPGGTPLWERTYAGAAQDFDSGTGVRSDAAGNVFVVGVEFATSDVRLWLTKYVP